MLSMLTRGLGVDPYALVTGGYVASGIAPISPALYRDRQILKLIRDLLIATDEFHGVFTSGLPEDRGRSGEIKKLASLDLNDFAEVEMSNNPADVPQQRTVNYVLMIAVRSEDEDLRKDELDRLAQVAANALVGISYGGATYAPLSKLGRGVYLPVRSPEARLRIAATFSYDVPGFRLRNTATDNPFA